MKEFYCNNIKVLRVHFTHLYMSLNYLSIENLTANLQVFGKPGCACNYSLDIEYAHKLFMGCKTGASLIGLCIELWRILASCPELHHKPTCQISGYS